VKDVKFSCVSCCTASGQAVECHNGPARTGVRWRGSKCRVITMEGFRSLRNGEVGTTAGEGKSWLAL
jgi:hypothetical protein